MAGGAQSSPFDSPRGQGHPSQAGPLSHRCPAPQQLQPRAEEAREGFLGTDTLQRSVPPAREPWGRAVVCGCPPSAPEDAGEGRGARGVPLSHHVPWAPPGLARLSHPHLPGAMPRLPPGCRWHPCLLSPGNLVSSHLGEGGSTTAGPSAQPSDFSHTGASPPWPGGSLGRPRRPGPTLLPGPSSGASQWGGGSPASAACVNPLYVVLKAYLVRKLVASRGRIWQRVLEWKILTACKKVWLVVLRGNRQLAGVQLA